MESLIPLRDACLTDMVDLQGMLTKSEYLATLSADWQYIVAR